MKKIVFIFSARFKSIAIHSFIGSWVGFVFYRHIFGCFFVMVLFSVQGYIKKIDNQQGILHEFRMFLNSIYTELTTGSVMQLAVINSAQTMIMMNKILKEAVFTLIGEVSLGQSEKIAWQNFSEKLMLKPAIQFSKGLSMAYEQGSDLRIVVGESIQLITDQMDLDMEMEVLLAAKKFEFYLLMIVPVLLLAFLSWSDMAYMTVLFKDLPGRIIMTLVLICLVVAYKIGEHIIHIEV
ncbi:MAG: hypothetical protein JXR88_11460 [Clostridia bacterium]|nr:hypothetical protein [Clostridia bacterium]